MASGLYSGVKVTMEAHQQMKEQKKQQQKNKQPQQQQQETVTETHEVYKQEKYNKH